MRTVDLVRAALFSAVLFVSQVVLAGIPNCELVTVLVIVFTLIYGKVMLVSVICFAFLEVLMYGMGTWVIMYFYIWPLLVVSVLILKRLFKEDFLMWSVVAGLYGLMFGFLCSLVYLPISRAFMFTYWISGLPWDIWHCITNFLITVLIGRKLYDSIRRIERYSE